MQQYEVPIGGLAALIAHADRPRPFFIDADNEHDGHAASLADAAADGGAWACTVARDVLAWDLDNDAQADAGDHLAEILAAEGWPLLRTASGQPGHRHLWTVIPAEAERARIIDTADRLGLPKPRPAMRPPLTPHRLGGLVAALDDPATFAAAVAAVRADDRPRRIDWRTTLATGTLPATWTRDRTGSAQVFAVCIGAAREGLDLDAVRALLADPANAGGESYRRRHAKKPARADRWLAERVWPDAVESAKVLPPADAGEARARLEPIAAAVAAHPWRNVSGQYERAFLAALLDRAQRRGTLTPIMSHRELGEAAACSRRTVPNVARRLEAGGWLQTVRVGRGATVLTDEGVLTEQATATRWRLLLPAEYARTFPTGGTPPARTSLNGATSRVSPDVVRDACRWGGLGHSAPRVIDTLADGPMYAHEIADTLGMNLGHMSARLLPKLALHGLLTRSGDRWSLVADLEAALIAAAADLGLSGRTAEVRARHKAERVAYLDWREHRRPHRHQAACARRAAAVRARAAGRRSTDRPLPLDLVATTSTPATTPEGRRSLPDGLALAGG